MEPQTIRPLAVCVFLYQNKILVFESRDPVLNQPFYRPLGGQIEFGEHSAETLVREMEEEMGERIHALTFLGCIENIFTFKDEPGHEIVMVYDARFGNPALYEAETLTAHDGDAELRVLWKDLDFFKRGEAPLYPEGLLELLWR
ncbi:MAG: NUDIX domain-containing protein [Thermodesulfobacteriota bacterium]